MNGKNGVNGHARNRPPPEKDSVMTDPFEEQNQMQIDYEGERKMMLEKNAMMNEV